MSTHNICFYGCKAILISTHNIRFYGEISKIIPNYHQIPSLSVPLRWGSICLYPLEPLLYDITKWATSWENLFLLYANDKGADQPAHPRSLISAFVVCCLDSIISLLAKSKISRLGLASVAGQASLCLTWSQMPRTGIFMTGLKSFKSFKLLHAVFLVSTFYRAQLFKASLA